MRHSWSLCVHAPAEIHLWNNFLFSLAELLRYFVASMGMMVISCFIASYDPLERLIESVSRVQDVFRE